MRRRRLGRHIDVDAFRAAVIAGVMLVGGCGDDVRTEANASAGITLGGDDYMDPPEPPIDCDEDPEQAECGTGGGSAGAQGSPEGGPCDDTDQCAEGMCVAPFEDGEAGEPVCALQCVADEDPERWCLDTAACCNAASVCTPRGFCVPNDGADDESGDDDDDDDDAGSTGDSGDSGDAGTTTTSEPTSTGGSAGSTGDDPGATSGSTG